MGSMAFARNSFTRKTFTRQTFAWKTFASTSCFPGKIRPVKCHSGQKLSGICVTGKCHRTLMTLANYFFQENNLLVKLRFGKKLVWLKMLKAKKNSRK
jgi:hypothetical protein